VTDDEILAEGLQGEPIPRMPGRPRVHIDEASLRHAAADPLISCYAAARSLGVSPSTVLTRCAELGIEWIDARPGRRRVPSTWPEDRPHGDPTADGRT